MVKKEWSEDAWLAVGEAYRIYGSSLPGGKDNVLVQRLAEAFSLPPDSIFKRLCNFAARDPGNLNKGLYGGGPDGDYHSLLLSYKKDRSGHKKKIFALRSAYPSLRGVI